MPFPPPLPPEPEYPCNTQTTHTNTKQTNKKRRKPAPTGNEHTNTTERENVRLSDSSYHTTVRQRATSGCGGCAAGMYADGGLRGCVGMIWVGRMCRVSRAVSRFLRSFNYAERSIYRSSSKKVCVWRMCGCAKQRSNAEEFKRDQNRTCLEESLPPPPLPLLRDPDPLESCTETDQNCCNRQF